MAEVADTDVEQTLHIARSISVYRIPPRPGSNGWRSGEWLMSDKLFAGRLRILAKGELCEIRLEDPSSGDLFAMCPVHYGQRGVCVEPVTDSSRYYVLRVEDPATHRHAFLGMGFDNRNDAFDFNEALVRHEQHVARERAARAKVAGGQGSGDNPAAAATSGACSASGRQQYWAPGSAAANSTAAAEVEGLYRVTAGLRLEAGQTIRVNVSGLKKPGGQPSSAGAGGFLSGLSTAQAPTRCGASPSSPCISAIPPPPIQPESAGAPPRTPVWSPPSAPMSSKNDGFRQDPPQQGGTAQFADAFSNGNIFTPAVGASGASGGVNKLASITSMTSGQGSWATFD